METIFISSLRGEYIPRNNAQVEALKVAREFNRIALNGTADVGDFLDRIGHRIQQINKQYTRCMNLQLEISWEGQISSDIDIRIQGLFVMELIYATSKLKPNDKL